MAKKSFKKTSALDILARQTNQSSEEVEVKKEEQKQPKSTKKAVSQVEISILENIHIYEELKEFIAPLSDEEIQRLETNILQEGIRDPLILWKNNDHYVLIDGHNRYAIAQKHGLDFPYKTMEFENKAEVEIWMVNNQLGRRNISSVQRRYLLGQKYETEKRMHGTNRFTMLMEEEENKGKTKEKIAQEENISESTVMRAAKLYRAINLLSGQDKAVRNKLLTYETSSKNIEQLTHLLQKKDTSDETKNECRKLILDSPSLEEVIKQVRPLLPKTERKEKQKQLTKEQFEETKKEIAELIQKLQKQTKVQNVATQEIIKQLEKKLKKLRG
ncbi:ParB N-terminal domain-containing protein [Bernardetia sp. MNP-M8]|uniref:ParB N-terminal domain-containing protein n=1 Tax=Bernardetia sp. MNP-M8 TaxID=3127470 RepID=UPI0030D45057